MRRFDIFRITLLLVLLGSFVPGESRAVIVGGGDGTQNGGLATPVVGTIGNNVGLVNGATGVYLQNGWVLTAAHVGAGSILFPALGTSFSFDGLQYRVLNPDGTPTDLLLFHLVGTPALSSTPIGATPGAVLASNGRSVIMNGAGQSRSSGLSYFDVSTDPWTVSATPTSEAGYFYGGPNVLRYGENQVVDAVPQIDDGFGKTDALITVFNPGQNPFALAQESPGDSGGAMFSQNPLTMEFELVGLILAIGRTNSPAIPGQPGNSAVFSTTTFGGNDSITASADLSSYNAQITAITAVPEPATIALFVCGALAFAGQAGLRRRHYIRGPV